ncbi:MAG: hypothetical protein ACYS8L_09760 [Planctomycetota bacterium]|jgi:hypothetical protein
MMGQLQRIFRDQELDEAQREEQVKQAARIRRDEIRQLLEKRLTAIRNRARRLQSGGDRLTPPQQEHLDRLKRAAEAIRAYGRYVLGVGM